MASLDSNLKVAYEVIIVNNSPDDIKLNDLAGEKVNIIEAKANLGFARGCNLGLNWIHAQNPQAVVWLINPDTSLPPDTLEKLPIFIKNYPELSIVGTLIHTPSNKIWFAGGCFLPKLGAIVEKDLLSSSPDIPYVSCDWVSGCSLLINFRHFPKCPQFDPAYFLYYEDFDFCRRYAGEGHQIAVTGQLAVIHYPSSITDRNIAEKLKHSTYSYLLTLERYTNFSVFLVRFLRLSFHATIFLFLKPQSSLGKFKGIVSYVKNIIGNR